MANNKIQLSTGTILIDLSADTVTSAAHIKNGLVGHLADGTTATGTLEEKDVKIVTYTLSNGVTASLSTSEVVTGQGFSVKLKAPEGYVLDGVTVTMGGVDITSQVFEYDETGSGSAPNLQTKTVSYTPTTSAQSDTVTADSGYDGLGQVNISVGAIPSEYIIPSGSQTVTENGTFDVSALAEMVVNVASGGGSIQTESGTFVGGDGRTQTLPCSFEPDIIYIHGTTTDASVRATETFLVVRDLIQWVKYYSSTANTSSFGYGIRHNITGLDSDSTTAYTYRTSYSDGIITMYAYTGQERYYFKSDITYSYKFIKYT